MVLDAVSVDGVGIPMKSSVRGAPKDKAIALLDTGSSIVRGPRTAVNAIYAAIPGSFYDESSMFWFLPCLRITNVAFGFAWVIANILPLNAVLNTHFVQ